ncbi:DUF2071 domain-containing protein [Nonomuraea sp. NEAU-A123]|uniref:DUF2071 domain-containing protein n=1 Tax=Nonomuraea sp. NEAU-A123 TaxID=2839649 RepID=UPI001BE4B6B2|nr:DUF2071 domain-containing protein [Nonomuraea sp. NEAU-A123]MBT2224757.1 DUF2071 domain-containing protein [Nonomuraea sp. NEAU-A123]
MSFVGTPRPRPRWFHARTELDDFAIVSYRVDADVLARHLPPGFAPMKMTFDDGPGALVSAVAFRDRDFHFRFFPPVGIDCGQINYRAYVTAYGKPGVWFFGTHLDHPVVSIPQHLWGMPWSRERIVIEADWDADPARWRLAAGDTRCEAAELTQEPLTRLAGFTDESDWLDRLTHPTQGWYRRRDGRVGVYSIWHPPMRLRYLVAASARFPLFERLGLITSDTSPHSVLAHPRLSFDIHTPPRRFRPDT